MDIKSLFSHMALLRSITPARPYSHHTKKGPGRKHQQTKTLTKEERNAQNV